MATRTARPQTASAEMPAMPLTVEGYSVLHQMMRFRWSAWRHLRPVQKTEIVDEAAVVLSRMEQNAAGQSALYSVVGHKGDLMFLHFRQSFDELNRAEMQLANLNLRDYLDREVPEEWKSSLTGVYLAASAQLLMKQREANEWISHYRLHEESSGNEFSSSLAQDAQYLTIVARHFLAKLHDLPTKQIEQVFRPLLTGNFNTVSAAYSVRALAACQAALPGSKAQINEWNNGWKTLPLQGANSAIIPPEASKLKFIIGASQNSVPGYYQITQSGFPKSIAPTASGLEVRRDYLNDKGEKLGPIRVGDTIHVRVRIRSTSGSAIENVAIVDLLPSGFEVVRDDNGGMNLNGANVVHSDVREDRVVLYVTADTTVAEIQYQAKVTAAGKLVVPSVSAQAMYNRTVQGIGEAGMLEVK